VVPYLDGPAHRMPSEEEEKHMQARRRSGLTAVLLALVALALFVAGCGGSDDKSSGSSSSSSSSSSSAASSLPGKGKPAITIGTKDFTEEFVLGELYAQALRAKGYTVNLKRNIGSTEIIDKALTSGQIDAYPEYTGETVTSTFRKNVRTSSRQKLTDMAKQLYADRGQMTSNPTPFEDVDAVITLKEFAQRNNLKTVADLKKLSHFTLAGQAPFKGRIAGLKGMESIYGIKNVTFKQLPPGLQYRALDRGDVDTADAFTTDPQLASGKYTVLTDPEGVFSFQNVLFAINKPKYEALGGAAFMGVINKVNALLTAPAIQSMNKAVLTDKKEAATVAAQFLKANGLAGGSGS
jgi:osmoprotectant transport system substrate-binding protein